MPLRCELTDMMEPVLRIDGSDASAVRGRLVLDVPKAAWNGGMLLIALVLGPLSFSWSALGLFIVVTYLSLLVGHSVGMHRMMIHRTFACSKPLERLLIYIGVLVGVAGPPWVLQIHDNLPCSAPAASFYHFFFPTHSPPPPLLLRLTHPFLLVRPPHPLTTLPPP